MNPAALKVCLPELQKGGIVIANEDEFTPRIWPRPNTTPIRWRTVRSTATA
jgi:hypothetical protein